MKKLKTFNNKRDNFVKISAINVKVTMSHYTTTYFSRDFHKTEDEDTIVEV